MPPWPTRSPTRYLSATSRPRSGSQTQRHELVVVRPASRRRGNRPLRRTTSRWSGTLGQMSMRTGTSVAASAALLVLRGIEIARALLGHAAHLEVFAEGRQATRVRPLREGRTIAVSTACVGAHTWSFASGADAGAIQAIAAVGAAASETARSRFSGGSTRRWEGSPGPLVT